EQHGRPLVRDTSLVQCWPDGRKRVPVAERGAKRNHDVRGGLEGGKRDASLEFQRWRVDDGDVEAARVDVAGQVCELVSRGQRDCREAPFGAFCPAMQGSLRVAVDGGHAESEVLEGVGEVPGGCALTRSALEVGDGEYVHGSPCSSAV